MDVPRPRKIGPKNQIVLPPETMAQLELQVGDEIFVAPNPQIPSTYLLIPARVFASESFGRALLDVLQQAGASDEKPKRSKG